jgi:D-alanine-D-alanine ligase
MEIDRNVAGRLLAENIDVAFIASHGKHGEDGTIQGLLEILNIPYVGSGVLASALALDKVMSKKVFVAEGIPTPAYWVVDGRRLNSADVHSMVKSIAMETSFPLIVKPSEQGSTIGLTVVKNEAELWPAIEMAVRFDQHVLIEQFVKGTEVTVGIIGNDHPQILPSIQIVSAKGLYDYEAKYTKGLSEHIIPPRLSTMVMREVEQLAIRAHEALGCRGISRTDIIIDPDDKPWVLEVNTLPGMTETSLVPDAARAAGIGYADLVEMLVNYALEGKGEECCDS